MSSNFTGISCATLAAFGYNSLGRIKETSKQYCCYYIYCLDILRVIHSTFSNKDTNNNRKRLILWH